MECPARFAQADGKRWRSLDRLDRTPHEFERPARPRGSGGVPGRARSSSRRGARGGDLQYHQHGRYSAAGAIAAATGVRRFVYVSTILVNDTCGTQFREDDQLASRGVYGESKAAAEAG